MAQQQQFSELKNEITDMRDMLHTQLERLTQVEHGKGASSTNSISLSSAIRNTIHRRLRLLGLDNSEISFIMASLKVRAGLAEAWADTLATFAQQLPIWGEDVVTRGGSYALVGPADAGKTSLVSQLAARYVLENGAAGLTLLSLEKPLSEQHTLVRMAKMLDVPVHSVANPHAIMRILSERPKDGLLLIDTPSMDPQYGQEPEVFEWLKHAHVVNKLLVLPANTQRALLQVSMERYKVLHPVAWVLTKLDQCSCLGETLGVSLKSALPLAYITEGQDIPQDLALAKSHNLLAKAVALLKKDPRHGHGRDSGKAIVQSGQQSMSA